MNEELINESSVRSSRVLMFKSDKKGLDAALLDFLNENFAVTVSGDLAEVQDLERMAGYSFLVVDPTLLRHFDNPAAGRQAVEILNHIGEGVCIVNGDGLVLWANSKMEEYGPVVREGIARKSQEACNAFINSRIRAEHTHEAVRSRKYSFIDEKTSRYFEMSISPILNHNGKISRVATVVWEATASQRLQQRINAIDRAGHELVRIEAETIKNLNVEQRISLLQDKIVRYARELLKFDKFCVRLLNRRNNQMELLFGVGLDCEQTEIFANIENNGITGYVAATGRSYICNNPSTDPHFMTGLDNLCCSLTLPLRLHDKVIGTLNVESEKPSAFNEEDRQVAEIFARYIAIAMNILELMVVERHHTTGQAAEDIGRVINQPLSTILTEATSLLEEYIGHDDIRHRLQKMIDGADSIKRALRELQNGPKGIINWRHGEEAREMDTSFAGKRILVVDDEEFIRQTIIEIVREKGCLADAASEGREAIHLMEQKQYDLIISDIKMPYATGYEVFAAARQKSKAVAVILMTGFGYDPNHSIVRANREGLNAVLYKPFKVEQLLREIKQALGVVSQS